MKPFLITSVGGTATRFFARYLDQAPGLRVWHEDGPPFTKLRNGQGMVNGLARFHVQDQHFDSLRIAVILRNPFDHAEHCFNKGTWIRPQHPVRWQMPQGLLILDRLIERGAEIFRFEEITQDPSIVAAWVGVDPQPIPRRIGHVPHAAKLSSEDRSWIEDTCGWFLDKYGYR